MAKSLVLISTEISSWNEPTNHVSYSSYDIGMNADALIYYKNE
jgi:hypothetical protein